MTFPIQSCRSRVRPPRSHSPRFVSRRLLWRLDTRGPFSFSVCPLRPFPSSSSQYGSASRARSTPNGRRKISTGLRAHPRALATSFTSNSSPSSSGSGAPPASSWSPIDVAVMVSRLLCLGHTTYRFQTGIRHVHEPDAYPLDPVIITDNYARYAILSRFRFPFIR